MNLTSSTDPRSSTSQTGNDGGDNADIIDAIRHSSFEQLMAAAGKWCPHALGDVVTVLLTDSPDTAAVRRQAARIAKVQLREPDIYFRRETGALGARPMSPGGAQQVLASGGQTTATSPQLSTGDQTPGSAR